jgi:hypothetical protein
MMLDRIGINGSTQGVNVSNTPIPKCAEEVAKKGDADHTRLSAGAGSRSGVQWRGAGGRNQLRQVESELTGHRWIADAVLRATLVAGFDHQWPGVGRAPDQWHRGPEILQIHVHQAKILVFLFRARRQSGFTRARRPGHYIETDLVLVEVIPVRDAVVGDELRVAVVLDAHAECVIDMKEFIATNEIAEKVAQLVYRAIAAGERAGAGAAVEQIVGQSAESGGGRWHVDDQFPCHRWVAHANGFVAALAVDLQGYARCRSVQFQFEARLMHIYFHVAEELVTLDLALRVGDRAQLPAIGHRKLELVAVHVIAVGDIPVDRYPPPVDGLGADCECLVGFQKFIVLGVDGTCKQGR